MRHYYSLHVHAKDDLDFPQHLIMLGPGRNVFTVLTDNLETVVSDLKAAGVVIYKTHCLSEHQSTPGDLFLLPGEGNLLIGPGDEDAPTPE